MSSVELKLHYICMVISSFLLDCKYHQGMGSCLSWSPVYFLFLGQLIVNLLEQLIKYLLHEWVNRKVNEWMRSRWNENDPPLYLALLQISLVASLDDCHSVVSFHSNALKSITLQALFLNRKNVLEQILQYWNWESQHSTLVFVDTHLPHYDVKGTLLTLDPHYLHLPFEPQGSHSSNLPGIWLSTLLYWASKTHTQQVLI